MKKILKSLLKTVLARKVETLLGTGIALLVSLVEILQTYLLHILPQPSKLLFLKSIEIALVCILLTILAFFYYRPKLKPMFFGVHKNIKTGEYFCSRCYLKDKKHYPLETTSNGWKCRVCGQWKEDPNNPVTPIPTANHWRQKP